MLSAAPAEDVQNWAEGCDFHDSGDYVKAISKFQQMNPSARVKFNIGCCRLASGDVAAAHESFKDCVASDKHLAVGYLMLGLTDIVKDTYEEAVHNFKISHELMRGNRFVDYRQLGFKYQMYASEVLCNWALACYKMKKHDEARQLLLQALGSKTERPQDPSKLALDKMMIGKEWNPVSPPKNEIFRPPRALMANIKKKDYLGTAKVVSTQDAEDCYACFSGIQMKKKEEEKQSKLNESPINPRENLLKDLRRPESIRKLRPTVRREAPTAGTGKSVRAAPKKPVPKLSIENAPKDDAKKEPSEVSTVAAPKKTLPVLPLSVPEDETRKVRSFSLHADDKSSFLKKMNKSAKKEPKKKKSKDGSKDDSMSMLNKAMMSTFNSFALPQNLGDSNSKVETQKQPPEEDKQTKIASMRRFSDNLDLTGVEEIGKRQVSRAASHNFDESANVFNENDDGNERKLPSNPGKPLPVLVADTKIDSVSQGGAETPKIFFQSGIEPQSRPSKALPSFEEDIDCIKENDTPLIKTTPPTPTTPTPTTAATPISTLPELPENLDEECQQDIENTLQSCPTTETHNTRLMRDQAVEEEEEVEEKENSAQIFEIQYSYIRQVCVPQGANLEDVLEIARDNAVPENVELRYVDDIGRQKLVTDKQIQKLMLHQGRNPQKLLCFSKDNDDH